MLQSYNIYSGTVIDVEKEGISERGNNFRGEKANPYYYVHSIQYYNNSDTIVYKDTKYSNFLIMKYVKMLKLPSITIKKIISQQYIPLLITG